VKNLLVLLGKRVHDLRAAKGWSQEEFAHVSGLHRTYIGQIERGEKNISFGNLVKISGVLGVTLSELLSGLEDGGALGKPESKRKPDTDTRHALDLQKLVRRLSHQRTAMERTIKGLEELTVSHRQASTPSSGRPKSRRSPESKKN
jgi:transcriptional regulator with XRE-family HTH domain